MTGANTEPAVGMLADMVGYQEGSVVSKTLINRKTGTVTLFAFDEGEGFTLLITYA